MLRVFILLFLYHIICLSANTQELSQIILNHKMATGLEGRRDSTLCLKGELVLSLYGKDHIFPFRRIIKKPDKLLTISEFEGRQRKSGFDGEKFWVQEQQSMGQGKSIDIIQSRVEANLEGLAKYFSDSMIISVEKIKYERSDYLKLTVRTKDEYILHYFISPVTYLIDLLQISIEDPSTYKVNITEYRYSDYRDVNGIIYPFRKEYYFNQEMKSFERIQSITLKCEANDKLFIKL